MKCLLAIITAFITTHTAAQYRVHFQLSGAASAAGAKTYLAGNFNNWQPSNNAFAFHNDTLTLLLDAGTYEYKLTHGTWEKVECAEDGAPISNRLLQISGDTMIQLTAAAWAENFGRVKVQSTANPQVVVMDTAFVMPQLQRARRIMLYLPADYNHSRRRYEVIYMQDGQNLFDAARAFAGEWGIDETLAALPKRAQSIVVAIDHGDSVRFNEYSPYNMERYGTGEGAAYADFLAHTLKPYIDKNFRTRRGPRHTTIAGSSMGGLISFYTALKYPKSFGRAGVFSPSFWVAPQALEADIKRLGKRVHGRIYFYAGKAESDEMVPDILRIFGTMQKGSHAEMTTVIRTDGLHNEARWRVEFPLFYNWLKGAKPRHGLLKKLGF